MPRKGRIDQLKKNLAKQKKERKNDEKKGRRYPVVIDDRAIKQRTEEEEKLTGFFAYLITKNYEEWFYEMSAFANKNDAPFSR